ncbi:2'-deoxynucleoside 5'-phosphate N-hydrolase 1 isoform X1 [Mus pahari]|uniref:2'-deoxynucleoside 5'-phosphate N-hydrolase 1 isoform X1 n=1 Tax=Mus pahari TaxID=10093 RepID=UPI001114FA87|nr:2'-deoxynucleoside 5'-phosphate N-hydrolase 1 isoform X1 [Mus pahari]
MAASGEPAPCSVYFCGSIRGGREDQALYARIVSRLRRYGKVFTEHVADAELEPRGEEAAGGDQFIHERDLAWLRQADVVVAEVTQPSLGVGYELGRAVALGKPILCLFRPQSGRGSRVGSMEGSQFHVPPPPVLSAMIRGAADGSRFQVWDYAEEEVEAMLHRYFEAYLPRGMASSGNPSA